MNGSLRIAMVLSLFVLLPVFTAYAADGEGQQPASVDIPGITSGDMFPHACVDCHIKMPEADMDVRISTQMEKWTENAAPSLLSKTRSAAPEGAALKGRHPLAPDSLKDIPAACNKCHSRSSKLAPEMGRLMHVIHLTGGQENHFITLFQGECTHCHKFDPKDGKWSIPSGPEK